MVERGRPKKEDTPRGQYRLRTDATDEELLDYLCERTGKTKAEIIRIGLRVLRDAIDKMDDILLHGIP